MKTVTACKRHRNDVFDRRTAIDDRNDDIIDCRRGESPCAEGRKQYCFIAKPNARVMVADQRLTGRHPAPYTHLSPR